MGFTPFQLVSTRVPAGPTVSRLRLHEELLAATNLSNLSDKITDVQAARGPTVARVRAMVGDAT